LIASADGQVRYVISKPLPSPDLTPNKKIEADARLERQLAYVRLCDLTDAKLCYSSKEEFANRMRLRMNLAALHQGV
jgi:hypothetical protein